MSRPSVVGIETRLAGDGGQIVIVTLDTGAAQAYVDSPDYRQLDEAADRGDRVARLVRLMLAERK